jgi:hypothetical protein
MVFWSSSEVPENGTGLVDYQTNAAVDRWLKEKALLSPDARNCTVPKGIFGDGAMLRMIAYGTEMNVAYPPKPANPNQTWEPQWAAKVRVKSVANAMLGMGQMGEGASGQPRQGNTDQPQGNGALDGVGQGLDKLKGVFGF